MVTNYFTKKWEIEHYGLNAKNTFLKVQKPPPYSKLDKKNVQK
jgi:hypothetical protein